ncbi:MAG: D-alanine--D-alanine ligase [Desulforhabdus sp.]|jgi:D-alanine-D-alanine ligase|nr:D-alanine--D-alanine ligase [Desulforhabdus sp.]
MKVGMTYDLRRDYLDLGYGEEETAEFDKPDTIDGIDLALQKCGYQTERIGHVKNLVTKLAAGESWDIVFNISEGLHGFGREAQVPALLDAYGIAYTFSDPLVLSLTLHKAMTKRVIRDLGIPTADFCVVEAEDEISRMNLSFPLFAKPVAEGTGKGISGSSKILSKEELISVCRGLLAAYRQPVLIEAFLPGREFTVGIIGTGEEAYSVAAMEVLLKRNAERDAYTYVNKENYQQLVEYRLVEDELAKQTTKVALAAWRGLGCRDAGRVDLRVDEKGVPNFIEVNPLAGLNPTHSDLPILCRLAGISFEELIDRIMASALKRANLGGLKHAPPRPKAVNGAAVYGNA